MPRKKPPQPTWLQRAKDYQGMIIGGTAATGAIVAAILFGGDLLHSEHPPWASVKSVAAAAPVTRVAQLEKQLNATLQQLDRQNDENASSWCNLYLAQEMNARLAASKRPDDSIAQQALAINTQLRKKWCHDAVTK